MVPLSSTASAALQRRQALTDFDLKLKQYCQSCIEVLQSAEHHHNITSEDVEQTMEQGASLVRNFLAEHGGAFQPRWSDPVDPSIAEARDIHDALHTFLEDMLDGIAATREVRQNEQTYEDTKREVEKGGGNVDHVVTKRTVKRGLWNSFELDFKEKASSQTPLSKDSQHGSQ